MGLVFINTKGVSQRPLVEYIIREIRENPKFFLYVSRLFATYKKNDPNLLEEIRVQIEKILRSPRLNLSTEKIQDLFELISEIYNEDRETFSKIRAEILENTIYYFGPFSKGSLHNKCFIEPVIQDKQTSDQVIIIGNSEVKCDFVFFYNEASPIEFVECKADIANVIPRNLPFEKVKSAHKKKLLYLHKAYEYLKEYYKTPVIYFACYNINYEEILNNLQNNWGFKHMKLINAEEILKYKTRGALC